MGQQGQRWSVWILLLGVSMCVRGITRQDLLPFGRHAGDQSLDEGNDETQEIRLETALTFYDGQFDQIYINTNGFVALEKPTGESEYLGNMPASFGMIAALQGDLDTSDGEGKVFFRQDSSSALLQRAADHINRAFPEEDTLNPISAVVVTWVDVASHQTESRGDRLEHTGIRNTFQLVIASLETKSFAILLYPREAMHFQSTSSYTMHAGFSKGQETHFYFSKKQGQYYRITDDTETSVKKLAEQTNSGKRGVWVYEIGRFPHFTDVAPGEVADLPLHRSTGSHSHQRPVYPDLDGVHHRPERPPPIQVHTVQFRPERPAVVEIENEDNIEDNVFTYNSGECGRQKCSRFGECRNYLRGRCCQCKPGFNGNGVQCVPDGVPQRMNGKVRGRMFVENLQAPVDFTSVDLHSYVVVNEGRAYVAISGIPANVGFSLLPLWSIGGIIGWTFALQQPGFKNGFSIVGGEFRRKAELTFLPDGEHLIISQEFKGIDEHNHLMVETILEGIIPEVPQGATVQIDPYTEIYQYSTNLITASSTREYVISLTNRLTRRRSYMFKETITFQGCQHDEAFRAVQSTQMLSVNQVLVMYDRGEQLMRYSMFNKIGDGGQVEENACFTGRHGCDTNAVCRPGRGNQFTCECVGGFNGDGHTCYDIDECRETPQICGSNAVCSNHPGTYRCECRDGFQFASDGQTCVEVQRPVDPCRVGTHDCDVPERARCTYTGGSSYICTCLPGFMGDGRSCQEVQRPVDPCRVGTHDCDVPERARCTYTGGSSYICTCLPGFMGDGRSCQDIDECRVNQCHENAVCFNTPGSFTCQCNPGFHGDGFQCSREREKTRCQLQRESALGSGPRGPRPVPRQYVPTCDAQGEYDPIQCHASIRQCWCVDRDGQEISGTRTGPGRLPDCGQVEENACFTGRHGCDTNAVCRPGRGNQFTCECVGGFNGDGHTCYDIDECRETPQICGSNAVCSNHPGTYRCECRDGFQFASDGQTCVEVQRPVDPCRVGTHDCDVPERARCTYTGGSSYICTCLPGFMGDGRSCQDIDECRVNQCHENAVCFNTPGSFTCQCNPGFHGDGFQCSREREKTRCQLQRESALGSGPRGPRPVPRQYVPTCDAQGEYDPIQCHASIRQCWCVDRDGQEISGTRTGPGRLPDCHDVPGPNRPTPDPNVSPLPPGSHILFAQTGKIEYIPLEGHNLKKNKAKTALHLPEKVVIGIAFDCVEKMVYWTDISTPAISKASLQSGEPVHIIKSDLSSPEGIAIDHLGRNVFWTDSMMDRIEVSSLDGSHRRVLINTDLVNPRAILTDPTNGYIYWADWNRDAPKIEMAYMDGTNRRVLAKVDLGLPNGLTYNPQTSLLCWADAGTHKVECMNPQQGRRRQLMEGIKYPFGLTTDGRNLYYTDWTRRAVVVVDRHARREVDEFQPQKRTRLYGITTAHAHCPHGQNYCSTDNGGCTHFCLARPTGRSCRCPNNAVGLGCVEHEGWS